MKIQFNDILTQVISGLQISHTHSGQKLLFDLCAIGKKATIFAIVYQDINTHELHTCN